jgi:hypothetical protein
MEPSLEPKSKVIAGMDHATFRTKPEYPPSTITLRKGKYYISVTVPKQMETLIPSTKQIRRSTGTSDLNLARQRQHRIADGIYKELDAVWEEKLIEWEAHLKKEWLFNAEGFADTLGVYREGFDANRHRKYLEEETHATLKDYFGGKKEVPANQVGAALHLLTSRTEALTTTKPKATNGDTLQGLLEMYLERRNWNREKSKETAGRQINLSSPT